MINLIHKRRSTRIFLDKQVEKEKINKIMDGVLLSPTSRDKKPWKFVIVTNPILLNQLAEAKHGAAFIKGSPLAIVVCADTTRSDVWIEDTSIASTYILLLAEYFGLGSCWIQIRERMHDSITRAEDYVKNILDIPKEIKIESIIALGYKGENKEPKYKLNKDNEKIFVNKYGNKYLF